MRGSVFFSIFAGLVAVAAGSTAALAVEVSPEISLMDLQTTDDTTLVVEVKEDLIIPSSRVYTTVSFQHSKPREHFLVDGRQVALDGGLKESESSCGFSFAKGHREAFVLPKGRYTIKARKESYPVFVAEPNPAALLEVSCRPAPADGRFSWDALSIKDLVEAFGGKVKMHLRPTTGTSDRNAAAEAYLRQVSGEGSCGA